MKKVVKVEQKDEVPTNQGKLFEEEEKKPTVDLTPLAELHKSPAFKTNKDRKKFIGMKVEAKNPAQIDKKDPTFSFKGILTVKDFKYANIGEPFNNENAAKFFQFEGQATNHWYPATHFQKAK